MALINCPECGRQVSDIAHACPNCGYPIAELAGVYRWDGSGKFGRYDWIELERRGNSVLVITRDIIELRRFDASSNNWASSEIRSYLNGAFLNNFTAKERSGIQQVGQDLVFLLSVDEAGRYFTSNGARMADYHGQAYWWWLRSPGSRGSRYAAYVHVAGSVVTYGHVVDCVSGVRPALWLNL